MDAADPRLLAFSTFLQLESAARQAETVDALRFTMVNEPRRLIPYHQAALAIGPAASALRIEAVSGVAVLDRNAPFLRWLAAVLARVAARPEAAGLLAVAPETVGGRAAADWAEWCPPCALWCPLKTRDGRPFGALWLVRETPWAENERVMVERLAECYAHAWLALAGPPRRGAGRRLRRPAALAALAVLAGLGAVPVRQSALAPAEIVAVAPLAVSAPIDGVIARFRVAPNQPVAVGQPLFAFDDTTLRNQVTLAERTLAVAEAELRQATQGAMVDRHHAGEIALLESQVRLRRAELDYARSLLDRVVVTAERAGVAVFADVNDWIGRPVATGQRILQIADPDHTELRIALPVRDAIALEIGAPALMFLDAEPLAPLPAALTTASYEAEPTPAGVLAYRLTAAFPAGLPPPRIGLQGTAKIYGERVPLGLQLFRRPLVALRQWLGL